jgi:hypothetical protein
MHRLSPPFFPHTMGALHTRNALLYTHFHEKTLPVLQRKEHDHAHPLVMSVTQDLEESSVIGVSEISAQVAYLFLRANDLPDQYRTVSRVMHYISWKRYTRGIRCFYVFVDGMRFDMYKTIRS